jgi:uncharacterized protein (DUF2249 family)
MKTIDARHYAPKDKHNKIFEMFFNLSVGESMMLINDHDPKPLYYQFAIEYPETFEWVYQSKGPEVFEILITKLTPADPKH